MGNDEERMKDEIRKGFASFGVDIKFEADEDLAVYRRGDRLLTYGELQEGLVVWGWYHEHGEEEPRVDSAFRLEQGAGNSFILDDGSSFSMDIEVGEHDDECVEEHLQGIKRIYEAVR